MKLSRAAIPAAVAAALGYTLYTQGLPPLMAQQRASVPAAASTAQGFFESARTTLSTTGANRLQPVAGTAMRTITAAQNVENLRAYLATGDTASVFSNSTDAAARAASEKLRRVLRDPSLRSAQLVSFDLGRIEAASPLTDTTLRLCQGVEPYCSRIRSRRWEEHAGGVQRLLATIGGTEGKPAGQAIFIREEGNVHGVLNVGGLTYLLRQLTSGIFVITTPKIDEVERSKDDVEDPERRSEPAGSSTYDASNNTADTCPNPATKQVLDVLVMWTDKARAEALDAGHDIRQLIRHGEALADASFHNSNINGSVRALLGGRSKYKETGDMAKDVKALLTDGAPGQDVRDARRKTKADVAVLVVDHPEATTCGRAAGISVAKDMAYAVVNWKCITDKYSFIHEVGHLAGAWHDPATVGPGVKVDPPYAHGYVTGGKQPVATIMAYRESCSTKCGRVWYWSNPFTKSEDGDVLGTPNKNFDACIWRQRLPVMTTFDGG